MVKFLKYLSIVFILIFITSGLFVINLYFSWPLWLYALFISMLVALAFGGYYVYLFWIAINSRSRLILDSTYKKKNELRNKLRLKWDDSVKYLKYSELQRTGDPVYVLPWYLMIGRTDAGKTTALTVSNFHLISGEERYTDIAENTKNFDWWFSDEGVIIECAGKYFDNTTPEAENEWDIGLDLLAKHRSHNGVDGIILTIPAEDLKGAGQGDTITYAVIIRKRIERLMQSFGRTFPVYLVITHCDKIYGFERWGHLLPGPVLTEAMGWLSDQNSISPDIASEYALSSIFEQLQILRLSLIANIPPSDIGPELLLFPSELLSLKNPIRDFLHQCLRDSPYLSGGLLRGIFFCSAAQQGGAQSDFLPGLSPVAQDENMSGGIFLQEVFRNAIPSDRFMFRSQMFSSPWIRLTRTIGLISGIAFSITLCILISIALINNSNTLALILRTPLFNSHLSSFTDSNIKQLVTDSDILAEAEYRSQAWYNRWMARTSSVNNLSRRLKERYLSRYHELIQPMLYKYEIMSEATRYTNQRAPDAHLIVNIVRHLALLDERLNGGGLVQLESMPPLVKTGIQGLSDVDLTTLTVRSLAWDEMNNTQLAEYRRKLIAILREYMYSDPQMRWLIDIVDNNSTVSLSEFWLSYPDASPEDIPESLTHRGQVAIGSFMQQLKHYSGDNAQVWDEHEMAFNSWYQQQRFLAWQNFARASIRLPEKFTTEAEWSLALANLASDSGPYFKLLSRLNSEFSDQPSSSLPEWLREARILQSLRIQSTEHAGSSRVGKTLDAASNVGSQAIKTAIIDNPKDGVNVISAQLAKMDSFQRYFSDVSRIVSVASAGSMRASELATAFHAFDLSGSSDNETVRLVRSLSSDLRDLKLKSGTNDPDTIGWSLIEGPWRFVMQYAEKQASCHLQNQWENNIVQPSHTFIGKDALIDYLYGLNGVVWKFLQGPATPFVRFDGSNYRISRVNGYELPFSPEFITFINGVMAKRIEALSAKKREQSEENENQILRDDQVRILEQTITNVSEKLSEMRNEEHYITLTSEPVNINEESRDKPYAALLSMQCAKGEQSLNNYNFTTNTTFRWSINLCSDMLMKIRLGSTELVKRYDGDLPLADFIGDFRDGGHRFIPTDFPHEESKLNRMGVKWIDVHYRFDKLDTMSAFITNFKQLQSQQKEAILQKEQLQSQISHFSLNKEEKQLPDNLFHITELQRGDKNFWLPSRISNCWN
ncbi:hypothetical protein A3780_20430 [Kosakonia radicincitans]|uniref:type VI secretion protein IcmF/TssM N-terminal domain-containing protein n=1 Tax=Kosakonia radicincitans TaxID=283686 RepID=UPI000903B02C|nr:type VI secretion protein IcmF/TssM N-terminal domain-containing protein [Kosakonia radicincitans]APG19813.1 hypothetical protein A3780_20430 [Kosakonia radicincitans]